jgi:WD40 repeat protein
LADAFVSYARKDAAFARQIHDALSGSHAIWMDWKSILPTAEWWTEVTNGIEASDNFVLLISPNSIASPICNLEIDYALSRKRIVPVLIEKVDEKNAFKALRRRRLNLFQRSLLGDQDIVELAQKNWVALLQRGWIEFYRTDNFTAKLADLSAALEVDIDYVREHTRLLVRANDWIRHARPHSLLLRGDDLLNAEAWASEALHRIPASVLEHTEYIAASRMQQDTETALATAQTKRTKQLRTATLVLASIGALAVVAAIALLLIGTQARNQANEAVTQVSYAQATLTPIPLTLEALNSQISAADFARLSAEESAANAGTQAANAVETLTPIPATLTAVAADIREAQDRNLSVQLGAAANSVLAQNTSLTEVNGLQRHMIAGDPQLAALLAVHGITTAYSREAHDALLHALDQMNLVRLDHSPTTRWISLALSPDGRTLVEGSIEGTIRSRSTLSGQILATFQDDSYPIRSLAFSPDGHTFASGNAVGAINLWDLRYSSPIRELQGHTGDVLAVEFDPRGKTLLSGGTDAAVRLWNIDIGAILQTFETSETVYDVAVSPNSRYVAFGVNEDVQLLDVASFQIVRTLEGHTEFITAVDFSPDSMRLLSASADNTIRLWDVETGQPLQVQDGALDSGTEVEFDFIQDVAFGPTGRTAVSSSIDTWIRLWDVESGRTLQALQASDSSTQQLAYDPNGNFISGTGETLIHWNFSGANFNREFTVSDTQVTSLYISPDSQTLLVGSDDGTLSLWNIGVQELTHNFDGHRAQITGTLFNQAQQLIISASRDNTLRVWSLDTGLVVQEFSSSNPITSLALSPDGVTVLTGDSTGVLRLWNVETGQFRLFSGRHDGIVLSNVFNSDGRLALSTSSDGTARLWDVDEGKLVGIYTGHSNWVTLGFFLPDGTNAMTGSWDGTLQRWDTQTLRTIEAVTEHSALAETLLANASGRPTLGGDANTLANLWEIMYDPSVYIPPEILASVTVIAFTPDGQLILTGHRDGKVRVWNTDYHELVSHACSLLLRDFTDDERQLFGINSFEATCPPVALNAYLRPTSIFTPVSLNSD